ncbi:hypothetical protein SDC9_203360 [bioreactor metagenome]|uniref:Uncharacterized protein n=1 Tax=bioreactor metagenome TaxID=1076179 RepID=A0A645IWW6_9ZZZZ
MEGTWPARTVRSGSATVIMNPIMKLIIISNHSFLDFVSSAPILSPMGIIDMSAPRVKSPIPKINITAPITKSINKPLGIGVNA